MICTLHGNQAFGVGAFEEEDDDIYGIESLSNYDREIGEGDDRKQLSTFGWTAPKHRTGLELNWPLLNLLVEIN